MSYEVFIGLRHLKGRNRSKVVSLLTTISILGVLVGVWALTVVLSVLSGFGQDLRKKIIESTPNMVVDRYHGEMVKPKALCKKAKSVPGITGCSPFVLNEIMLASEINTSGALLRGIDKNTVRIKNATKQMKQGKFSYLFDPTQIPSPPRPRIITLTPPSKYLHDLRISPDDFRSPSTRPTPFPLLRLDDLEPMKSPSSRRTTPPPTRTPEPPPLRRAPPAPPRNNPKAPSPSDRDDDAFQIPLDQPETRPTPKDPKDYPGILLGQELATSLSVRVGQTIRAISPIGGSLTPMGPSPRVRRFRVAGIFYTGMYEYDLKFAFVTLKNAQTLFKMEDTVSGLELSLRNIYDTYEAKKGVRRALGGGPYRVRDWIEMNSQLFGALQMEKVMMFLILALIVLVASFNIVSTLTMVVLEKSEEIAILKSMGATRGSIMRIFMIEGVSIGVVGTVIGLLLGWRTCLYLLNHPIKMNEDVYYISHLPVQMNGSDFLIVALAAIVISFLATIYPALQAARLHPIEGLQHE